jgi:hypothetical protein
MLGKLIRQRRILLAKKMALAALQLFWPGEVAHAEVNYIRGRSLSGGTGSIEGRSFGGEGGSCTGTSSGRGEGSGCLPGSAGLGVRGTTGS